MGTIFASANMAHHICTIVENTEAKMKHLEDLKMNLSKYQYPKQLTDFGINKALSIYSFTRIVYT